MNAESLNSIAERLVEPAVGVYSDEELDGLPVPVRRYLGNAVASGTPLARTARIRMRGHIKIGSRWIPFRGRELLTPHRGFLWTARAAGVITGSDHYIDGRGALHWNLAGLVTVMHQDGSDTSRSAAERAAAEAIWIPTTLLPRFDVEWETDDEGGISARYHVDDKPVHVHFQLTSAGQIRSVVFDRWGDPDNTGIPGLHTFGGEFASHRTFDGVTIPDTGRLGWQYGTERWAYGEFFRYEITGLELVPDGSIG